MDGEKFFKDMYYNIWQSHGVEKFDEFYAKDFSETILISGKNNEPLELQMNYDDLLAAAQKQKHDYENTNIDIKKIIFDGQSHISVNFYASSNLKKNGHERHRCVCGIWHLNKDNKIDNVWAVVTPYYFD